MLFHILDIPCPVFRFLFPIPILQVPVILWYLLWHCIIIARLKRSPDRFVADKIKYFRNVLQIFLTILIHRKRFFQQLQSTDFSHGDHEKIPDCNQSCNNPWKLIWGDSTLTTTVFNSDFLFRRHSQHNSATHGTAIKKINGMTYSKKSHITTEGCTRTITFSFSAPYS